MATAVLSPGSVVGQRFRLVEAWPSAFGDAWRATRIADDSACLLVVVTADQVDAAGARSLAHATGMLQGVDHPLLVPPSALGPLPDGGLFAAFPWPGHDTLASRLARQGTMPLGVVAQLGIDLLGALHELHQRGIVCAGLSPHDVVLLLDDAGRLRAQLLLAGMVSVGARGAARSAEGNLYAPPECLRGEASRPEGDVWAFAAVLSGALSGAAPFVAAQAEARRNDIAAGLPSTWLASVAPEGLVRVLRQALVARVEARPPDADAMRFAWRAALSDQAGLVMGPPRALRDEGRAYVTRPVAPPVAPPASVTAAGRSADLDDLDALVAAMHAEAPAAFVPSDHPGARASLAPEASSRVPPASAAVPAVAAFDLDLPEPTEAPAAFSPLDGLDLPEPTAAPAKFEGFELDGPAATGPSATLGRPAGPALEPGPALGAWASVPEEFRHDDPPQTGLDGRVIKVEAVKPRRMRVSVPIAAAVMFAVTVALGLAFWEATHPEPGVRGPTAVEPPPPPPALPPAATDGSVAAAADGGGEEGPVRPPREESAVPVEFGEQTRIALPAGLAGDEVSRYLRHVVAGALPDAESVRGFAACAEGQLFVHPGGLAATIQTVRAPVRCEGQDVALVPDLDGDGRSDVAAVDARRSAVLVVGSRGGRVLRTVRLPGAFGLAAGLRFGEGATAEPGVVVFASPGVGGPSLVALGLKTGRLHWRTEPWVRPGDPLDLGLSVGPDLDGDARPDVAFGLIDGARRCVLVASGATGAVRWRGPRCEDGLSGQGLVLGPDVDEDGAADVVVADAEAGRVRVLSGRSGRELRRVSIDLGRGGTMAPQVAASLDLTRDGMPAVAVARSTPVGASVEVYSTNDAHRVGAWAARAGATPPGQVSLRVVFVQSFPFAGARSLLAATPDGVVCLGAGRRPDEGLPH
jgi:hypothetical protein